MGRLLYGFQSNIKYIDLISNNDTLSFCNQSGFCPGQCSYDFFIISNIQNKYGVKIAFLFYIYYVPLKYNISMFLLIFYVYFLYPSKIEI